MKATPDCVACMFRQALNTARLLTDDPDTHLRVLRRIAKKASGILSLDQSPAIMSKPVYTIVSAVTGIKDPYKKIKHQTNRAALKLLPRLRSFVSRSRNPLDAAIHVAVAGNVIDLGIGHAFDFNKDTREIIAIMKQKFAISAINRFRKDIRPGTKLLYTADNAGEIVFDRLLVEQLLKAGADITMSVKSAPIINDATIADAREAGLTSMIKVIRTGSNDVGINWRKVSKEFRTAFARADVILAKGHGNFETCDDRPGNIYFLLKAKCVAVADRLGVKLGDLVFKHSDRK